ncbi:MAG: chloride channel protein, partial [Thermoprotei archaeon]
MIKGMHAIDEELRYFEKWVAISIIIGIISGLGAVIFHIAIELSIEFFLGNIAGYIPPRPGSDSVTFVLPQNNLLLILPPVIGGLLSGFLVFKFAPEAEGHGTDAAIEAFHYKEGAVRSRVPLIKLVASAITIGSGGSAGKEGPVAQIGSGFGSLLAEKLKLSPKDRRIALAVGIGSGIGAIFKAPFGGAIFASEVLYIMDFEPEVIPPAFIASLISYIIMGLYSGWSHVFWAPSLTNIAGEIYNLPTLLLFAILGFINGIVGIIYVKTFYGVRSLFRRLEGVPDILKPAIGGLFTGIIGVFFPYILESSYGWLQMLINGNFEYIPIYVLILLPFLKILATSLSISSGGSGGVFAPALVIGGSIGALVWHIAKTIMPGYNIPVGVYVIIGMMAFFGGIGKVPIATILMVGEMTGEYQLFAPSLIATTISYLIT